MQSNGLIVGDGYMSPVRGIRCILCEMHTDRYEEGVEDGELPESQYGAIGRRG
jgi:hypothetical protein